MLAQDIRGMALRQQRLNIPTNSSSFIAMQQIATEEQSGKMAPDMEVCMKQRCVNEFLNAEKSAPIDSHNTC
jgi:hypothetical protein